MRKLIFVIGKAPSEVTREELLSHLMKERERMSLLAQNLKGKKKAKKAKKESKSRKLNKKELAKIAELTGLDLATLSGA